VLLGAADVFLCQY